MRKKDKSVPLGTLIKIISIAALLAVVASAIVLNFFIPVKYLSSYIVIRDSRIAPNTLRVRFLDVSGSCTLIEFPDGKNMLVDGGDGSYSSQLKILKTLNKSGLKNIDYLISTSILEEHCGGLNELVRFREISKAFLPFVPKAASNSAYESFIAETAKKKILTEKSFSDTAVDFGNGNFFAVLSPFRSVTSVEGQLSFDKIQIKSLCTVVYIEYFGTGILLLSDCPAVVQENILNAMRVGRYAVNGRAIDFTRCKIIQVADHGSDGGVYAPIYDFLGPEKAIIQVYGGQPSVAALSNAQSYAEVYRTDERGTVTVNITADGYGVS